MLSTKVTVGSLDRKITIQSPVIVDGDANSDIIDSWTNFAQVWAKVTKKGGASGEGSETFYAGRLTYDQSSVFTIRYKAGLKSTMRIVYKSKSYRITSITENNSSRERFLDLVGEVEDTETV